MSHPKNNLGYQWIWNVTHLEATESRADVALLKAFESAGGHPAEISLSRSQVHRLMKEGQITVNGHPIKPNRGLVKGDVVKVTVPPPVPLDLQPEDREIKILFEDRHLAVLNKPQGLSAHPSSTERTGTLVHILLHHIKDLSGIGGALRPGIVHRLDKGTSGVMVIAKTDEAHQKLVKIFSTHSIERKYWALCYGSPTQNEWTTEGPIGRSETDRRRMTLELKEGKHSKTRFKCLQKFEAGKLKEPYASWIEATLETGRTHQVRVHLTASRCSIIGDPLYGTPSTQQIKWKALPKTVQDVVLELPAQALHARVLGFIHPITGEPHRYEAEPPESFNTLLEALQQNSSLHNSIPNI